MKRLSPIRAAILFVLLSLSHSFAATLDWPVVAKWPDYQRGFATGDLAVRGDYAFIVAGKTLTIADVRNPFAPVRVAICPMPFPCGDSGSIVLSGKYAFVGKSNPGGVAVVDITDPTKPKIAGNWIATGAGIGPISLVGNRLYAGNLDGGITVLDITNPAAPTFNSRISTPGTGVVGLVVSNTTIYAANRQQGISGSMTASLPSITAIGITTNGIAAVSTNALTLFDFSGVARSSLTLPQADTLFVTNNLAFVNRSDGMTIVDISNFNAPSILAMIPTAAKTRTCQVQGNYLFMADRDLDVFEISNPGAPYYLGGLAIGGSAVAVAMHNNLAYIADTTSLQILDCSDLSHPREVGRKQTGVSLQTLRYRNGKIVMSGERDIYIFDVSTPSSPELVGNVFPNFGQGYGEGDIHENLVFTIGGGIFDCSTLWDPLTLAVGASFGTIMEMNDAGNILCSANNKELKVFDVSDPTSPLRVGYYNREIERKDYINTLAVRGNIVFLNDEILDISRPWAPAIGLTGAFGGTYSLVADKVAVCFKDSSIRCIDVSKPFASKLISIAKLFSNQIALNRWGISDEVLAIPTVDGGVEFFQLPIPAIKFATLSADRLVRGQSLRISWGAQFLTNASWAVSLSTTNGAFQFVSGTAVKDTTNQWHLDWTVDPTTPTSCDYFITIKDLTSGLATNSPSFCVDDLPHLTVAPISGGLDIQWTSATSFSLQESAGLKGPWTATSASITNTGGRYSCVTPATNLTRFYRLALP